MAGLTDTISDLKIKMNEKIPVDTPHYELISSHVGRSTFITNCLVAGISPYIVMKYTGHSKIETLSFYIRIAGNMTIDAFERFEKHLKF